MNFLVLLFTVSLIFLGKCEDDLKNKSLTNKGDQEDDNENVHDAIVATNTNITNSNITDNNANIYNSAIENKGMLKRAAFVLLACTGIVVVYFGVRLACARKRKKERRYGLLSNDVEMNDIDSEDDETVFDKASRQRL